MLPVTYDDVLAAVPRVRKDLSPTPLLEWPGLSQLLGLRFFLKHENHQPVEVENPLRFRGVGAKDPLE